METEPYKTGNSLLKLLKMWHKAPFSCLICAQSLGLHRRNKNFVFIILFWNSTYSNTNLKLYGLSSLNSSYGSATKRTCSAINTQPTIHLMYFTHNLSYKYCATCPPVAHRHSHINDQKWDLSFPVGSHIRMDFASATSCSHFVWDPQTTHWESGRRWDFVTVSWTF